MKRSSAKPRGPLRKPGPKSAGREPDDVVLGEDVADDAEAPAGAPALVRLNKYLADHGIASRRKCDELIAAGKVSVDDEPTTELGAKIDPERQTVEIDGFVLTPRGQRKRYYLLNKPSGVVCTNEVRETRPRAVDLVTDKRKGRIYTVGRLDEESKGLIVLTNDGEFANRIMHPRYGVEKTYVVKLAGKIDDEALQRVREGVHLSEGRTAGARVLVVKRERESSTLALTLREGMNREIRRAFARVGFKVVDLRRTRIGPVNDRGLKIGRWRELRPDEVAALLAGRNETDADRGRPMRDGHRGRPTGARRGATRGVTRDGALRPKRGTRELESGRGTRELESERGTRELGSGRGTRELESGRGTRERGSRALGEERSTRESGVDRAASGPRAPGRGRETTPRSGPRTLSGVGERRELARERGPRTETRGRGSRAPAHGAPSTGRARSGSGARGLPTKRSPSGSFGGAKRPGSSRDDARCGPARKPGAKDRGPAWMNTGRAGSDRGTGGRGGGQKDGRRGGRAR